MARDSHWIRLREKTRFVGLLLRGILQKSCSLSHLTSNKGVPATFSFMQFRECSYKNLWIYWSGWWFQPLCKILVSWGYYSQYMESHQIHVPNHQQVMNFEWTCLAERFFVVIELYSSSHWRWKHSWFWSFWERSGHWSSFTLWKAYKKLWKITTFHGKIHYKWWFSMVMLVYRSSLKRKNTKTGVASYIWIRWCCGLDSFCVYLAHRTQKYPPVN